MTPKPLVPRWIRGITFSLVCLLGGVVEVTRWADPQARADAMTGWMAGVPADWFPYLPLLILLPVVTTIRIHPRPKKQKSWFRRWLAESAAEGQPGMVTWGFALGIALFAFFMTVGAGWAYRDLPPAYHDEFSYLFQAETFHQSRLWLPSHDSHPELFDQMHVLNEGHFASRYFPGTGIWMAPFVAAGNSHLGHQLAQAVCAMLMFWIGRELSSNGVGILAGFLFAVSPGMILFSNLLLAHHPTLAGLLLFLWAFLSWMSRGTPWLLPVAGTGLAWAMLCRPMTAAGFALPFGILFAIWWMTGWLIRTKEKKAASVTETQEITRIVERYFSKEMASSSSKTTFAKRTVSALLLALPLIGGIGIMLITQHEITGSAFVSPYQQYTDIYTPRHRYGFDNVIEGEKHLGPKVLENYDKWAENLTPARAVENAWTRLKTSMRWTLGIVPLLLAAPVVLLTPTLGSNRWLLIVASILSLHAVHLPYWFVGIMGWHYVLESAPLWILLFAEGSARLERSWVDIGSVGMQVWWRVMIAIAIAVNLVTLRPVWPGLLPQGFEESAYSRRLYDSFNKAVDEARHGQPAIVFILPDPTDRHIDYVTNSPMLNAPVLRARLKNRRDLKSLAELFPDRAVLTFDAAQKTCEWVRGPILENKAQ